MSTAREGKGWSIVKLVNADSGSPGYGVTPGKTTGSRVLCIGSNTTGRV